MRLVISLCLVLTLAVACQPAGGPSGAGQPTPAADSSGRPLGAPVIGGASTLDDLITRGALVAEEWQDDPVLAEVEVNVGAQRAWAGARLTYVAAEADRMLQLDAAGSGFTQQRPSLGTLQVQPVPAEAVAGMPVFPDDAVAPQELATDPSATECGVEGETTVLYASGAPFAWDGTAWTREPAWIATVTAADGRGVRYDGVNAAAPECLEP